MKRVLILLLVVTSALSVNAKKGYMRLEDMVFTADLIVTGEIVKVNNNTYKFKINQALKGTETGTITVTKFKEWTCDNRYQKCVVGEKLCLFLEKGAAGWSIIDGGHGEKPIIKNVIAPDWVYYKSPTGERTMAITDFTKTITALIKIYPDISAAISSKKPNLAANNFAKLNWLAQAMYNSFFNIRE
jgi:hypothetical protein